MDRTAEKRDMTEPAALLPVQGPGQGAFFFFFSHFFIALWSKVV
jgi:hypothetical protein